MATDTLQNIEQPDAATTIREIYVFDNSNGKLGVPAFIDDSSSNSWISQELRELIQSRHNVKTKPAVATFRGVELESTGVLKVTWQKANGVTTHFKEFNITASIPESCHLIIGHDILSKDETIFDDSDPILVFAADEQTKETKKKTKERKEDSKKQSKTHKEMLREKAEALANKDNNGNPGQSGSGSARN